MIIRHLVLFVLVYATVINSQLVRMPVKKNNMKRSESHTAFRNLDSKSTKIYNYLNSQYTGTIKVGSNEKEFKVILDTGSSIFWIPEASAPRQFSHRYACSSSSTCQASRESEYQISYEKGDIRGYKAVDQIKIGDMQIPKFPMLLVYEVEDMPGENFDGILGLTLGRHYDEFPTLLQTLKRYGQIEIETFSMYLGDKPNSLEEATGEIIFGGYDPKYAASEFQFVQAYSSYKSLYWTAKMTKIGYGDDLKSGNIPAMFDSGTSLLIMPQDYIEYIIQQAVAKGVKFAYDSENQLYMCSCNARNVLEDLVFDFDGVTLRVSAESYVIFDGGTCYLGMEPTMEAVSLNNPIILGDVLLKDYYLLYSANNNTIGFAKAVPTSNFPVYYTFLFIIGLVVMVGAGVYFWTKKCKHTRVTQTSSSTFGAFKSKGVVIGSSFSNELSSQYRYNPQRSEDNEARGNQVETREVPNYPPAS